MLKLNRELNGTLTHTAEARAEKPRVVLSNILIQKVLTHITSMALDGLRKLTSLDMQLVVIQVTGLAEMAD